MSILSPPRASGFALLLNPSRLAWVGAAALLWGLLLSLVWQSGLLSLWIRVLAVAAAALLAFGLFEQWPSRLPRRLARWVLQVLAVAAVVPLTALVFWSLSTDPGAPPFYREQDRLIGFLLLSLSGLLLAPWFALAALVRQKDALARHQALAFALERSELERQAVDARLHLLQAQVAPHFLFNTLANVQALVDSGSGQASSVLGSLISYLRAAVPRLGETDTDLGQELELARAYLQLMQMRMPDRLQFGIDIDDRLLRLRCPPLSLLSLVENAVRHGIDPSEEGGRIDIEARLVDGRCRLRVRDTGVGLQPDSRGLGTGLSTLRERLRLAFGESTSLRLSAVDPHGLRAEIELPLPADLR
ncbi:sensor histidine kinase [Aquimonas sp.]|jgi:signal transduction histidine kinase|uniref:sensor histidine kinase n=1 Tax=Aquimonas sp. TaxID=1872588 RepID=UPI0037BFD1EE